MVEQTRRMYLLVEQVVGLKSELDSYGNGDRRIRARPPASLEILAGVNRVFEERGLTMPRDYARVLRAHDGIEHMWRTRYGSVSLFGHRELLDQLGASAGATPAVVIATSDAGEEVSLIAGVTDLAAVRVTDPGGRVAARFPGITSWLEWMVESMRDELEDLSMRRRRDALLGRDLPRWS